MKSFRPYQLATILIASIVIVGFWPSYYGLVFSGNLDVAPLVHIHNAVFMGWIVLLFLQATLVSIGRTSTHRKTGVFGIILGTTLLVVGVMVVLKRVAIGIADGHVEKALPFMLIPLTDLLLFTGFFVTAVIFRTKPSTHKRLMILATVALLGAPISRTGFLGEPQSPALFMLVWFSPILLPLIVDVVQKRKTPWVYVTGLLILVLSGVRIPISHSEAWLSVARLITGSA